MGKILGFYHICMVNNWQSIVAEQVKLIENSGLYNKTDKISVSCVGDSKEYLMLPKKYEIVFHNDNIEYYEMPIMIYLQQLSKKEDFIFWYIHTKGVVSQKPNVNAWRKMMQYFIIERHEKCIEAMTNIHNCDACGIELRYYLQKTVPKYRWDGGSLWWRKYHFAGNFFWSKASYIRKLPDLEAIWQKNIKDRFIAEDFIGMTLTPRFYTFFNTKNDLHKCCSPYYGHDKPPYRFCPYFKNLIKVL